VPAVKFIFIDMVDHNGLAAVTDFVADRCTYFQFLAGFQPEPHLVLHTAGDPAVFRNARHSCETHTRRATDYL
jgi:hypothetical protein